MSKLLSSKYKTTAELLLLMYLVFLLQYMCPWLLSAFSSHLDTWFNGPEMLIELIRMVTSSLLHVNWDHINGNMLFMVPFAMYVERNLGPKKLIGSFVLCAFVGAAAQHSAVHAGIALGASGAIMGLMSLSLTHFMKNNKDEPMRFLALFPLGYFFFENVAMMPLMAVIPIGIADHLGGMLTGILLAAVL